MTTMHAQSYALFGELPIQLAPMSHYFDLYTLVPQLFDQHPSWGEEDLRNFVEEKSRSTLHSEDLITLRTALQLCRRLRGEFEA